MSSDLWANRHSVSEEIISYGKISSAKGAPSHHCNVSLLL